MNILKKIYKQIKKYDVIVLARHIGADPDALGSTLGLKEVILNTFPNKKVYAVGTPANRHKYIGQLDTFNEEMYNNSLLIVLDTPDIKRIDGVDPSKFEYKIKIDHHPFVEKFCDIELIDDTSTSASQLVIELIKNTKLIPNKEGAAKLYTGVVGDTNRFLFSYTSYKTFELVAYLIKETDLDFTNLYEDMYLRSIQDMKLQSYVIDNITITENGLGYIKLSQEDLDKIGTDAASATNTVNGLHYIDELYAWIVCAYDKNMDLIRTSIRSRGPIINEVATHYNGGGHIFASGARPKTFEEADKLIEELDNVCKDYNKKGEAYE